MARFMDDITMTQTQKEAILNRIAEGIAHGLNSAEISIGMHQIGKAQLIRLLRDFLEAKPRDLLPEFEKLNAARLSSTDADFHGLSKKQLRAVYDQIANLME